MIWDQPTDPPCADDAEEADAALERYLVEQAGEVVRSGLGEDWRTWSRERAAQYLATILGEDFASTLTSVDAATTAAREVDAWLRMCAAEQRRLDAEAEDTDPHGFGETVDEWIDTWRDDSAA